MPHPGSTLAVAAPFDFDVVTPAFAEWLRRHRWVLTAALLFVASLALGRSLSATLAAAIERPVVASAEERSAPTPAPGTRLDPARLSELLALELTSVEVSPTPVEIVPSALPLRVLGTLLDDSGFSMATLEQTGEWRTHTVMVGNEIAGALVVAIERDAVLVVVDGRSERVGMQPPPAGPPVALRPAGAPGFVARTADGRYEIPRATVEKLIGDFAGLIHQVRLIPAFENGAAVGFRVVWVEAGSVIEQLGLQRGDVLTRVNGTALTSPDAVLDLFTRLRNARRVDVDLRRGGAPIRSSYTIF